MPDEPLFPPPEPLFDGYDGPIDCVKMAYFRHIDREFMKEIDFMKARLMEFETFRHAWAEIVANNAAPGRASELRNRLEVMQGQAALMIAASGARLDKHMHPTPALPG